MEACASQERSEASGEAGGSLTIATDQAAKPTQPPAMPMGPAEWKVNGRMRGMGLGEALAQDAVSIRGLEPKNQAKKSFLESSNVMKTRCKAHPDDAHIHIFLFNTGMD